MVKLAKPPKAARSFSTTRAYSSAVYTRRIRRSVVVQPLCSDRWNWGHSSFTAAIRAMASSLRRSGSRLPSRMRSMPSTLAAASMRLTRSVPVSLP